MTHANDEKPPTMSQFPESSVDQLLSREIPLDYVKEWETLLARDKGNDQVAPHSAITIFRVGSEYLAISSLVVGQITTMRTIHRVPHIKNRVIKGVVNINGRLRLFISLEELLSLNKATDVQSDAEKSEGQMILIEDEAEVWTFGVSEVMGVFHCDLTILKNVPVTIVKSTANFVKGVFTWRDKSVGLLDEQLLMFSLRRSF